MLLLGDCLIKMKELEDNSVDSIVTDPPYGLSFMGKKWDYDVPSVEIWKECLRVLKPGGHLLAFAGTRTQHRMCINIEDAGFEIRDMIAWVYGSGFPKSHNIGKAVDKLQGNERKKVGEISSQDITSGGLVGKEYSRQQVDITKGNSPWEGWGTALKPALEPITMARKPFKTSVAENVLKNGVGGINIDGCRVGTTTETHSKSKESAKGSGIFGEYGEVKTEIKNYGRFPANFIHDGSDEVEGLFPQTKSNARKNKFGDNSSSIFNDAKNLNKGFDINDSGSASRFFYCAKASKKDRNEGLPEGQTSSHPTVKPTKLMQYLVRLVTPPKGICLDPFMGSGSTGKACKKEGFDFIGIELDPEYFEIAKARIENLPNTLF